nr:MAG TPA: hypothetical protein [Caudoviricetes sp.]
MIILYHYGSTKSIVFAVFCILAQKYFYNLCNIINCRKTDSFLTVLNSLKIVYYTYDIY